MNSTGVRKYSIATNAGRETGSVYNELLQLYAMERFLYRLSVSRCASKFVITAYAIDKSAAQKGRWRTAETTLHAMSLLGGWPGALMAQRVLHHKSIKKEFQWTYKVTVVLNVAVTAWLLTPHGPARTLNFLEKVFK